MSRLRAIMNGQVSRSQEALLQRLASDRAFAEAMAVHPSHARLGAWLPRSPGAAVLELGCGPGKYVALLDTLGYRVVGVDPLEFPTWQYLREHTRAEVHAGVAAERLPFPDASFDHAVCLGAVLYFADPLVALKELCRVVRPGGRIVLRTVNRGNLYTRRTGRNIDPASRNLYTLDELTSLMEAAGLHIGERFSYGFYSPWFPAFWWYLMCVWLPLGLQDWISARLSPTSRLNHAVFATRPATLGGPQERDAV
jgi:SAM-dependent methyltransferase